MTIVASWRLYANSAKVLKTQYILICIFFYCSSKSSDACRERTCYYIRRQQAALYHQRQDSRTLFSNKVSQRVPRCVACKTNSQAYAHVLVEKRCDLMFVTHQCFYDHFLPICLCVAMVDELPLEDKVVYGVFWNYQVPDKQFEAFSRPSCAVVSTRRAVDLEIFHGD